MERGPHLTNSVLAWGRVCETPRTAHHQTTSGSRLRSLTLAPRTRRVENIEECPACGRQAITCDCRDSEERERELECRRRKGWIPESRFADTMTHRLLSKVFGDARGRRHAPPIGVEEEEGLRADRRVPQRHSDPVDALAVAERSATATGRRVERPCCGLRCPR